MFRGENNMEIEGNISWIGRSSINIEDINTKDIEKLRIGKCKITQKSAD
jgi:hypothetical protein